LEDYPPHDAWSATATTNRLYYFYFYFPFEGSKVMFPRLDAMGLYTKRKTMDKSQMPVPGPRLISSIGFLCARVWFCAWSVIQAGKSLILCCGAKSFSCTFLSEPHYTLAQCSLSRETPDSFRINKLN